MNLKNGYLYFNVENILKDICHSPLSFEEENDKFVMKRNVGKGIKGTPTQFVFPRLIKIKPSTAGLIVGEGYLGINFIFCNSNEQIILEVLNFLSQFNKKPEFVFEVATKNMPERFVEDSKKSWEGVLHENIRKIRIREEFNNTTKKGSIHISLYNTLFVRVLREIIFKIKNEAENNSEVAADYLKGIIAAEGNVNVKSTTTQCVYMLRISASKKEERGHYKKCLKRVGIEIFCEDMPTISPEEGIKRGWKTTKGRAGAVIISKWENFIKVLELGLLDLHEDKRVKFYSYFFNNKFTKQFMDFGYFLDKEFTMKETQTHFGFRGRSLNRVLTFCNKGYILRRKINNRDYIYNLTDKYTALYNKLVKERSLVPSF